jgi:hypothetical protein
MKPTLKLVQNHSCGRLLPRPYCDLWHPKSNKGKSKYDALAECKLFICNALSRSILRILFKFIKDSMWWTWMIVFFIKKEE